MMTGEYLLEELQNRIKKCNACDFVKSFKDESIPEHKMDSQWSWWFKNKFPCEKEIYYTFFKYDGKSNIILVTLRPSTGWVVDTADFMLANALKACGLVRERFELVGDTFVFYEGILVTDLIKCRGLAKEAKDRRSIEKALQSACIKFLREEFDIVRECSGKEPKIFTMGKSGRYQRLVRDILWKYKDELGIEIKSKEDIPCISFHSSMVRASGKYNRYIEYVNEIRNALRKLGIPA